MSDTDVPLVEIAYHESWRSAIWNEDVPSRPGWTVTCSEHGPISKGWAYATETAAKQTATRHKRIKHGNAGEHDMNEPWDVYSKLEDPMGVLGVALAQWQARDDARPQPEVRRAANTAMDAIDQMLRELQLMRSRLVGEIRAADDATAVRVDALLAARRGLPPEGSDA